MEHAYILKGANKKDFLMLDVSDIPIWIEKDVFGPIVPVLWHFCVVNLCRYICNMGLSSQD
jgi:hypothetical protein